MQHSDKKPHVCGKCYAVFDSECLLAYHCLSCNEADKKVHVCDKCKIFLRDGSTVIEHRLLHHKDEDNLGCGTLFGKDDRTLTDDSESQNESEETVEPLSKSGIQNKMDLLNESTGSQLENKDSHAKIDKHSEDSSDLINSEQKPQICDLCYLAVPDLSIYAQHMENHMNEDMKKCPVCSVMFLEEKYLQEHIETHKHNAEIHVMIKGEVKPNIGETVNGDPETSEGVEMFLSSDIKPKIVAKIDKDIPKRAGKKTHQCKQCGKFFGKKSHFDRHMIAHRGEKPHKCDLCEKSFSDKSYMIKHRRRHTHGRSFPCEMCEKSFFFKGSLMSHMLLHTGEKKHVCRVCGKGFLRMSQLREHENIHTGEKKHLCNLCGKAFLRKNHMRDHMKTHTGEKPHICDQCGKAFTCNSDLKKHLKGVHSGLKPHKCTHCNKAFALISGVNVHMARCSFRTGEEGTNSHTDNSHKCDECDKAFTHKLQLEVHKKIHLKTHECTYCSKLFYSKSHLTQHLPMHTGVKNFKCKQCGKSFGHNSSLSNHRRKNCRVKQEKPKSSEYRKKAASKVIWKTS